ncbi:glycosyltransferase family 8 protein [Loktanella sp. S4079]|uniref:glycosyltransferase family 8 protein n=1 Tax=Loktanella sp. S4079 TaxID=579483 RepID=UPI0005FA19A7|nr:glycosyltransferase family 8 protein [Loktanella sp. S4079]KJZ19348.1 hypothetical protein TW80_11295 [Loktanella sp. S4079]
MKSLFASDTTAKNSSAVVFCVDDNYLPYALFAAQQIANTVVSRNFDIVICAPQGTEIPSSLEHLEIRLCTLHTDGLFEGLYLDARRTEAVYHRLALPNIFGTEYKRVLYLDADIHVHCGDFSALFDLDLSGHSIAAVRDNYQWTKPNKQMPDFANVGLSQTKYFNSGVILMDTAAYVEQEVLERCIAYGREHNDKLRQHDQELINCILHGDWAELSPVWNWQQPIRSTYYEVMQPIMITHFIGPHKPWRDPQHLLPPRFAIALRAFLARHLPEHAEISIPSSRDISASYIRKLTFKNVIRSAALRRYMMRFPNDMLAES